MTLNDAATLCPQMGSAMFYQCFILILLCHPFLPLRAAAAEKRIFRLLFSLLADRQRVPPLFSHLPATCLCCAGLLLLIRSHSEASIHRQSRFPAIGARFSTLLLTCCWPAARQSRTRSSSLSSLFVSCFPLPDCPYDRCPLSSRSSSRWAQPPPPCHAPSMANLRLFPLLSLRHRFVSGRLPSRSCLPW